MPPFLTVKEAAELVGKSPSSIRRIIYPIIHDDKHADRVHIQPSVEEALQLRMKGENFAWRLSEELLRREVPADAGAQKGTAASSQRPSVQGDPELFAMLRGELEIKNQQIRQYAELNAKQIELISGLSERLREGNVLIASLQHRLALTDGRDAIATEPAKPKRAAPAASQKGSSPTPKSTKAKKGFFERLFQW
jgi:hypothetical protein